jgi:hypothetical protein
LLQAGRAKSPPNSTYSALVIQSIWWPTMAVSSLINRSEMRPLLGML